MAGAARLVPSCGHAAVGHDNARHQTALFSSLLLVPYQDVLLEAAVYRPTAAYGGINARSFSPPVFLLELLDRKVHLMSLVPDADKVVAAGRMIPPCYPTILDTVTFDLGCIGARCLGIFH